LVLRPARQLPQKERATLADIPHVNPVLACGYRVKERFQTVMAAPDLAAFDHWHDDAAASGLVSFQAVAQEFRDDYAAIAAAFTAPWGTGPCEGRICWMKLVKRLGDGRAELDWLGRHILHRMDTRITRAWADRQV
jgi:transposase